MKIKTKRGARRIRNQRVITRRFVTTRYYHNGCITPDKLYPFEYHSDTTGFIFDDDGQLLHVLMGESQCGHLDEVGTWEWGVI